MQVVLSQAGHCVNQKWVRRLMQTLGIEVIFPKINTSKPGVGHRIYPYLLRGLVIVRIHWRRVKYEDIYLKAYQDGW